MGRRRSTALPETRKQQRDFMCDNNEQGGQAVGMMMVITGVLILGIAIGVVGTVAVGLWFHW